MVEISAAEALSLRLRAQHLDRTLGPEGLCEAAGACGFQNTPPGAWELAALCRVEGLGVRELRAALEEEKTLLQAWSLRGAPYVFPTAEAGVFLSTLAALPGEEPWVYTQGITAALDCLGLGFYELLPAVMEAARLLERRSVLSKEELDRVLAEAAEPLIPSEKLPLWRGGTMYGDPEKQSVGGAVVSFMLRPCAFAGLVVFGRRQGASPEFVSPKLWLGRGLEAAPDAGAGLVRKFLRCYAPATERELAAWLGSSPAQARRLWRAVEPELVPVLCGGKKKYALACQLEEFRGSEPGTSLLLLGPHDPYLDARDRELIAPDVKIQRQLWRYVGNPGAVLRGGRAVGQWRQKTSRGAAELTVQLFEPLAEPERRRLKELAERLCSARGLGLRRLDITE